MLALGVKGWASSNTSDKCLLFSRGSSGQFVREMVGDLSFLSYYVNYKDRYKSPKGLSYMVELFELRLGRVIVCSGGAAFPLFIKETQLRCVGAARLHSARTRKKPCV